VRRPPLALLAAAVALVLPLAFSTALAGPFWSARAALVPLVALAGLVALVALLPTSARPAALAGGAFVGWSIVSAAASPQPLASFAGAWGLGTGAVFVAAVVGAWAIGAGGGDGTGRRVEGALLVGVAVNVGIALLQTVTDLSRWQLPRFDDRSAGLFGNPVFLAAFLAGGMWLVATRIPGRAVPWTIAAVAVAAAIQASGSRFAFAIVVVEVLAAFFALGRRPALALVVAVTLGTGFGAVLTNVGGGVSVSSRVTSEPVASGIRPRVATWTSATHAVARRPVLGAGPGRYGPATGPFRTLRLARSQGSDAIFADSHDLVVEYATTTGLVGLALLAVFLALVVRRAGWMSPLTGFGLAVLAMQLVEPQHVALTPLALLALGAAAPVPARPRLTPLAVACAAGVTIAAVGLIGAWQLRQADLAGDRAVALRHARTARALLPMWAEPIRVTARIDAFHGRAKRDRAVVAEAIRWRRRAAAREPDQPSLWLDLGDAEAAVADAARAEPAYRRALRLNPWSARAMAGLADLAHTRGDAADEARWRARLARLDRA